MTKEEMAKERAEAMAEREAGAKAMAWNLTEIRKELGKILDKCEDTATRVQTLLALAQVLVWEEKQVRRWEAGE